ncbi:MAG: 50S ribosomal protein L4 [Thermoprotei archaeon]|nr:MAG: 50S ribosomal protein L4 [Thermoprotei archaeon]
MMVKARSVKVYDLEGEAVGELVLPPVFSTPVRPDLIRRAVLALLTSRLQPKGTDPMAGERTTAESWGVGYGIARVPRIKGGRRAALVPQAVKGRRAHPPRVEKRIREFINRKEKRLATASAIAATADPRFVSMRGHRVSSVKQIPMIVVDELQELSRTAHVRDVLKALGLWDDVERAARGVRVRAGRGKMRGRRYKKPKSLLIVVGRDYGIYRAARNLPGVDVATAKLLNVVDLAPGGVPGRLTVYTVSAVEELGERFKEVVVWRPLAW